MYRIQRRVEPRRELEGERAPHGLRAGAVVGVNGHVNEAVVRGCERRDEVRRAHLNLRSSSVTESYGHVMGEVLADDVYAIATFYCTLSRPDSKHARNARAVQMARRTRCPYGITADQADEGDSDHASCVGACAKHLAR